MALRSLLVAVLAVLILCTGPSRAEDDGWTLLAAVPGGETYPEAEGAPAVEAVLVVRPLSPGRWEPIEGARVRCFTEDVRGASLGAEVVAEGTTDAFGVAVLEAPAGAGYHWLIDAPGHAVRHEYGGFGSLDDDPIILEPAAERRLRVLDPLGRPLVGARVEVLMGCGHAPPAQEGITDDAGIVTLGHLDDEPYDLWITAPGVRPDRNHLPAPAYDGSLRTILTEPAVSATGVVVDLEGQPVAGAVVRELDRFRGPKTRTSSSRPSRPTCRCAWRSTPLRRRCTRRASPVTASTWSPTARAERSPSPAPA